jgi:preprotein translocase subunit Sec61beta
MAEKVMLPPSFGGLTRFYEEYESKVKISPSAVILITALIIIAELILNIFVK